MEEGLSSAGELSLPRENPIRAYVNRATDVVARRYESVVAPIKEVSLRLLDRRRLPLALTAAVIIANAGCGNAEDPIQMPVFDYRPAAAGAPLPPEPQATPISSHPDKLKYKDRLPADIVSEQELWNQYHTRIWNTPNVKLHLRRAALTEEPIYQDLQRIVAGEDHINLRFLKSQTNVIEDRMVPLDAQLDIVLLPGEFLRSKNMTEEQKLEVPELYGRLKRGENRAWEQTKEVITRKGKIYIPELRQEIQEIEAGYRKGKIGKERYESKISLLNEQLAMFKDDLSNHNFDSFYDRYGSKLISSEPGGFYNKFGIILMYSELKGLFLTRRGGRIEFDEKAEPIGYRQRYYISIAVPELGGGLSLDPNRASFADPATFTISSLDRQFPLSYPPEAGISVATRHEFTHHVADHPNTDYVVLANYVKAYDRFMEGDDSLFYFVFETPRGNVIADRTDSKVGIL